MQSAMTLHKKIEKLHYLSEDYDQCQVPEYC